jgi:hypothetical protein
MARKETVSFVVHPVLAKQFREATKQYMGKLGLCFSAAMLQFLETEPRVQSEYIKKVFEAELTDEVSAAADAALARQAKRISQHHGDGDKKR